VTAVIRTDFGHELLRDARIMRNAAIIMPVRKGPATSIGNHDGHAAFHVMACPLQFRTAVGCHRQSGVISGDLESDDYQ
jgi:hypothetical protein